jgi:hypothetical protein
MGGGGNEINSAVFDQVEEGSNAELYYDNFESSSPPQLSEMDEVGSLGDDRVLIHDQY